MHTHSHKIFCNIICNSSGGFHTHKYVSICSNLSNQFLILTYLDSYFQFFNAINNNELNIL